MRKHEKVTVSAPELRVLMYRPEFIDIVLTIETSDFRGSIELSKNDAKNLIRDLEWYVEAIEEREAELKEDAGRGLGA